MRRMGKYLDITASLQRKLCLSPLELDLCAIVVHTTRNVVCGHRAPGVCASPAHSRGPWSSPLSQRFQRRFPLL